MRKTGIVYSPDYANHRGWDTNPEIAERVTRTWDQLKDTGTINDLKHIKPNPANEDDLLLCHNQEHIDYVRDKSINGYAEGEIPNTDIYIREKTFETALLSAGGVIDAVNAVMDTDLQNCFALTRPPGHHAGELPSGFCFFNNMACAIKHLKQNYDIDKVAVFDWDAHCGNGTMNIFYDDPSVLTISAHQDPHFFFPGTGFVNQIGEGEGEGYCINIPLAAGAADGDFRYIMDELVEDTIRQFEPDFIFVAAGQDGHFTDNISLLQMTDAIFYYMSKRMCQLADEICDKRVIMTFEGGYNIETLPRTNEIIISAMLENDIDFNYEENVLQTTKDILNELDDILSL